MLFVCVSLNFWRAVIYSPFLLLSARVDRFPVHVHTLLAHQNALRGLPLPARRTHLAITFALPPPPARRPQRTTSTTLPRAAPLRGQIGTVDTPIASDKTQIYGPFEAGFTAAQTQQLFECNPGVVLQGGIDTLTAEQLVQYECNLPSTTTILDVCGGHAVPYHYHERMTDTDLDACGGRTGITPDSNGVAV
jgi:hypothetical protein